MKALLLINAKARSTKDYQAEIAKNLTKHGVDILETSAQSPDHFEALVKRFRSKIDCVIVAGGDGSCHAALKILLAENLPLGVIPLGTANNLARSLSIPLNIDDAAKIIAEGNLRKIDVGSVNSEPFLCVSGMGLSTQVNRKIPADLKKRWGIFAYMIYLLKVLRRTRPFTAQIASDGKSQRLRSRQITVCNGKFYGSGLVINDQASLDDGLLDLVSTHVDKWWKAFTLFPQFLTGRYRKQPGLRVLAGKRLEITTSPPMVIDADGEIVGRTPAIYEITPAALSVFAPK